MIKFYSLKNQFERILYIIEKLFYFINLCFIKMKEFIIKKKLCIFFLHSKYLNKFKI
jgi:hypothetical protein